VLDIAIITTPRGKNTIDNSIGYLRRAGFNELIHVFAEPGSRIDSPGVKIHHNPIQLGCFKNYHKALKTMIDITNKPYISVLSDDFIYNKHTYSILENSLTKDGYYAIYSPIGMKSLLPNKGWNKVNMGWGNAYGGLYVFPVEIARRIINNDYYRNHLNKYEKNQQIDHCIPEVCMIEGINQYYHIPSLSDHTGYKSTIGHKHTGRERGIKFVK